MCDTVTARVLSKMEPLINTTEAAGIGIVSSRAVDEVINIIGARMVEW